jgi:hypothetical protein
MSAAPCHKSVGSYRMIQVSVGGVSYYEMNIINVKAFGGLPVPSSCHASCHGGIAVYSSLVRSIGQPLLIGGSMGDELIYPSGRGDKRSKGIFIAPGVRSHGMRV